MILYYWVAAIGICFIFKYGSILESFRKKTSKWFPCLEKLYKCCLCMGFWAGVLTSPLLYISEEWSFELIVFPFTCSCICWFADSIITMVHAQTNRLNKD